MPSSPSSPICRLDCPPGRPQAFAILVLLVAALLAVALCGLSVTLKATIAVIVSGYGMRSAVLLWRRPAIAVIRDARGVCWLARNDDRQRLERIAWRDYGYLVRLQARLPDSGQRLSLIWWTAAMPATQRHALRQAMNANRTQRARALPATVANPLL